MSLLRREELKTLLEDRKQPSVSIFLPMHRVGAEDRVFWQHQSDGLALFLAAEVVRSYRLPLTFDELVVVNDHFHLKPLLPLLTGDGRFYILAMGLNIKNRRGQKPGKLDNIVIDLTSAAIAVVCLGLARTLGWKPR